MSNPFNSNLIPPDYDLNLLVGKGYLNVLNSNWHGKIIASTQFISPRGTGKSTVLECYFSPENCRKFARDRKLVRLCQFSGNQMRTDAEVFVRLIGAVKDSLEHLDPDSAEYKLLIKGVEQKEAERPDYHTDANKGKAVLKDMLRYLQDQGYSMTLVLDEFHQMACSQLLEASTFSKMAELCQDDKLISFVVASDYDHEVGSKTYYNSQFVRIFGNNLYHVEGPTRGGEKKNLIDLIRHKLTFAEDVTFSEEELNAVLEITGGIPGLIQDTMRDLVEIKEEENEELSAEEIREFALAACTPLFEKWTRYFDDARWNTMDAVLRYGSEEEIRNNLDSNKDVRTTLAEAGLIKPHKKSKIWHAICPLFADYLRKELARRKPAVVTVEPARTLSEDVPVEPERGKVTVNIYGGTFVQNSGSGDVAVENKQVFTGISVSDIVGMLGTGSGDNRALYADRLSEQFRKRIAASSFPKLQRSDFDSDDQYELAYDEAFADYSRNLVEDVPVDENQKLMISEAQMQTVDERFEQARARCKEILTDEMLAAQSERCQFYLKLSVIVEDALELPGIRMDDYSPQLVLYGKALEQSLRDHFYPLFHREETLASFATRDTNGVPDPQSAFGQLDPLSATIGGYEIMIRRQKNYLAGLCQSYAPQTPGVNSRWWKDLERDILRARKIRNQADHANPISPKREELDQMCDHLLGGNGKTGILDRNVVGTELFRKIYPETADVEG